MKLSVSMQRCRSTASPRGTAAFVTGCGVASVGSSVVVVPGVGVGSSVVARSGIAVSAVVVASGVDSAGPTEVVSCPIVVMLHIPSKEGRSGTKSMTSRLKLGNMLKFKLWFKDTFTSQLKLNMQPQHISVAVKSLSSNMGEKQQEKRDMFAICSQNSQLELIFAPIRGAKEAPVALTDVSLQSAISSNFWVIEISVAWAWTTMQIATVK